VVLTAGASVMDKSVQQDQLQVHQFAMSYVLQAVEVVQLLRLLDINQFMHLLFFREAEFS
jgi:hypothetical protein